MSGTPDRRNPLRLIVNRETQLRILWLVAGGVFFCMSATLALSLWLNEWVWVVAVSLAVGAVVSLYVSRRIAGPFYRIEQDLEVLLHGATNGQEIRLRPGDPLQHLATLVNELIVKTRK